MIYLSCLTRGLGCELLSRCFATGRLSSGLLIKMQSSCNQHVMNDDAHEQGVREAKLGQYSDAFGNSEMYLPPSMFRRASEEEGSQHSENERRRGSTFEPL